MPENTPAFPSQRLGSDGMPEASASEGMTLRDWFAGQALSGMISTTVGVAAVSKIATRDGREPGEFTASVAYQYADAMMAERAKEQSNA